MSLRSADARIIAEISSDALVSNFAAIHSRVPSQEILPMIKADAYGHGAAWVGNTLARLPHLHGLGVATLEEGQALREHLGSDAKRVQIIVFSGGADWSDSKGQLCEQFGLIPVLSSFEDWRRFSRGRWPSRLPFHLKFNTGMNRLGIESIHSSELIHEVRALSRPPLGVLTHLGASETPTCRESRLQFQRFESLAREWKSAFPKVRLHFANSAAIWNARAWKLEALGDIVRPGLALYGIPPWPEARASDLTLALTLKAKIGITRTLARGDSVGYGFTYRAKAKEHIAILLAGYADGLHRTLGKLGTVRISGRKLPFIGRISMDLAAVRCTSSTKAGDWATILGPKIDPWRQASAAQTIPYELLTSISGRVVRVYDLPNPG
jgi:alanine racemase